MTPKSSAPINKVSLTALAGMALAVVFWALHSFTTVRIDADGAVLITTLVGALVGYFTPIAPGEIVAKPLPHDAETKKLGMLK
jgi:hypothetical protein